MLKRGTPNVKMEGRTSIDKWQRRTPQTQTPQCGCSDGIAGQFATKTNSGRRRKKKNALGVLRRTTMDFPNQFPTFPGLFPFLFFFFLFTSPSLSPLLESSPLHDVTVPPNQHTFAGAMTHLSRCDDAPSSVWRWHASVQVFFFHCIFFLLLPSQIC